MNFNFNLEERNVYSYSDNRKLIDKLVAEGKTTGDNHSESYMNYTTMNVHRMNRLDKRFKLSESDLNHFNNAEKQTWIVLTEAWCGDAPKTYLS